MGLAPARRPHAGRRRGIVTLLRFDRVTKRFERGAHGSRERVPLRDASMAIDAGEVVALVGKGRSGRTTVMRLAAGIARPTEGVVSFDGHELVDRRFLGVPDGIGYCHQRFSHVVATTVVDHVGSGLLGLKLSPKKAADRADEALERVGAGECADMDPEALDYAEAVRVSIARALVVGPRLLLVDDPIYGVDLDERDEVLRLLHSLAREDGLAVFFTVGSGTGLVGVDRAISIDGGELRGDLEPASADVHQLHDDVRHLRDTRPT
jgi:putative ABC transport system ATP-binding protein